MKHERGASPSCNRARLLGVGWDPQKCNNSDEMQYSGYRRFVLKTAKIIKKRQPTSESATRVLVGLACNGMWLNIKYAAR